MNLDYFEVLKLKGTWLYDEKTAAVGTKLCKVLSVTDKYIRLSNGSRIMTHIFLQKRQQDFRLATDEEVVSLMEDRYYDFYADNYLVIRALAHSTYKGWGGNAYSFAEDERLKQHKVYIDFDYVDREKVQQEVMENL